MMHTRPAERGQYPHTEGVDAPVEHERLSSGRRPHASRACDLCKRHKSRCERLESEVGRAGCHRCNVLGVPCSFEVDGHSQPVGNERERDVRRKMRHKEVTRTAHKVTAFTPRHLLSRQAWQTSLIPPPYLGLYVDPFETNDWFAAPMLAVQDRLRPLDGLQVHMADEANLLLHCILKKEQVNDLLEMFEANYAPWLNLPAALDVGAPLVILARCTVALRHLDSEAISFFLPRLTALMDDLLPKLMFRSVPSTDLIQALTILAMWSPIGAPDITIDHDERLRAAMAASLATSMRLHQSSVCVNVLREQPGEHDLRTLAEDSPDLARAKDFTRLWVSLSTTESLLCLGTARTPISRRSDDDLHAIETSPADVTEGAVRDRRTSIISQLLDVAEGASRIRLQSSENVDQWHKDVSRALTQLESLQRRITPLSLISGHDHFHNNMLLIYYYACRLTSIVVSMHWARRTLNAENIGVPFVELLQVDGVRLVGVYGQEAVRCAEGILEVTLSPREVDLLGTAPDVVFRMIAFSASILMVMNIATYRRNGLGLGCYATYLLQKTVDRLYRIAPTEDHVAIRVAKMIAALLIQWERRFTDVEVVGHPVSDSWEVVSNSPLDSSAPGDHSLTAAAGVGDTAHPDNTSPIDSFDDLSMYMDVDFWATFVNDVHSMPEDHVYM